MTPKQRAKARLQARTAKEQAKRAACRGRAALRKQKRAEKRRDKAAPRLALSAWAGAVKARDGGECAVCGCGVVAKQSAEGGPTRDKRGRPILIPLNVHHLLPKERYREFRTVVENGITLCPKHHKWDRYSAHRNPVWFVLWLRANRPEQYKWAKANMGKVPLANGGGGG